MPESISYFEYSRQRNLYLLSRIDNFYIYEPELSDDGESYVVRGWWEIPARLQEKCVWYDPFEEEGDPRSATIYVTCWVIAHAVRFDAYLDNKLISETSCPEVADRAMSQINENLNGFSSCLWKDFWPRVVTTVTSTDLQLTVDTVSNGLFRVCSGALDSQPFYLHAINEGELDCSLLDATDSPEELADLVKAAGGVEGLRDLIKKHGKGT